MIQHFCFISLSEDRHGKAAGHPGGGVRGVLVKLTKNIYLQFNLEHFIL